MTDTNSRRVYKSAEIARLLSGTLALWRHERGHLVRKYPTAGWKATLMATNAIGHLAELAWHHPDLELGYAQVTVKLMSHDVKGISDRDFALARKIEEFLMWRPGTIKSNPLEGPPDGPLHAYFKD